MSLTIAAMLAYNDEQSIAKTVLGCKKHVDQVVVVDEGSSDATAEIATALGAEVVRHETKEGYGAALRSCFEVARRMSAERMVIIDTEVQQDITELLAGGLKEGNDAVLPDSPCDCGAYGRRAIETIEINCGNGSTSPRSGLKSSTSRSPPCPQAWSDSTAKSGLQWWCRPITRRS